MSVEFPADDTCVQITNARLDGHRPHEASGLVDLEQSRQIHDDGTSGLKGSRFAEPAG
ncbi:hypothetical protein [Sulfurirhabdus autotrophica]|uniref:hypothetical protein n=1 Tax=Sulfurirhabdus autotrophica TaxID=1706046 RepID=UPI0014047C4B|nr:hypothetical protein [Sulfurirhabdus autotrophica]